jgi:tRNA(Ile)-lysidine synthase
MSLKIVVGLSGGLDSTVLLHVLVRMQQKRPDLFSLSAVHVHHGLQLAADDFVRQCETLCADLAVPLQIARVAIPPNDLATFGIEAAARRHRYQAFADFLPEHGVLALAHHRDDLVETALLQWIRGAGLEGLSAMMRLSPMQLGSRRVVRWRPLLDQGRAELLNYATAAGLRWIEDPTNTDTDLARNRIRHEVMPVLRSLRAGADTAMARSIAHLQTARELLELVTDQALEESQLPGGHLNLDVLFAQEESLAARIVRGWLKQQGAPTPPTRRLTEFLRQLRSAREPFAQMDLTDPGSKEVWRVVRERRFLRIGR